LAARPVAEVAVVASAAGELMGNIQGLRSRSRTQPRSRDHRRRRDRPRQKRASIDTHTHSSCSHDEPARYVAPTGLFPVFKLVMIFVKCFRPEPMEERTGTFF